MKTVKRILAVCLLIVTILVVGYLVYTGSRLTDGRDYLSGRRYIMNRRNAVNTIFSVIVSVGFVLLGFFVFSTSYLRAFEAGGSPIDSIKFYFCEIFGIAHNTAPAVNAWSEVIEWDILLPSTLRRSRFRQYSSSTCL